MKKVIIAFTLLLTAVLAFAKTHKYAYKVSCKSIWPAVKEVLKTSNKYNVLNLDSTELIASYTVGSSLWTGKRINSVSLNLRDTGCEMAVNTEFRGVQNNDAADFKKRVDDALATTPVPVVAPLASPVPAL